MQLTDQHGVDHCFDRDAVYAAVHADILERFARGVAITGIESSANELIYYFGNETREVFVAMFLDNRHRVLSINTLFLGTVDGTSVHPREVVKAALHHNAAAVILAHNHPSGCTTPSRADHAITEKLVNALGLIDVRVLDHIVVGGIHYFGFSHNGYL